jgi:hydrogenase small subunit
MSPFYDRLPSVPGFGVEVTAGEIGLGLTAAVVAGVTAHGLIKMIKPAPKPPAEPPVETRKDA